MIKGRSFLKLLDFTKDEIQYLIDLSKKLKKEKKINYWNISQIFV